MNFEQLGTTLIKTILPEDIQPIQWLTDEIAIKRYWNKAQDFSFENMFEGPTFANGQIPITMRSLNHYLVELVNAETEILERGYKSLPIEELQDKKFAYFFLINRHLNIPKKELADYRLKLGFGLAFEPPKLEKRNLDEPILRPCFDFWKENYQPLLQEQTS